MENAFDYSGDWSIKVLNKKNAHDNLRIHRALFMLLL